MKKTGQVDPLKVVVGAFLILATVMILWFIVRGLLTKEATTTSDLITGTQDSDYDGVIDLHDACPCVPGDSDNRGCVAGKEFSTLTDKDRDKSCIKKHEKKSRI